MLFHHCTSFRYKLKIFLSINSLITDINYLKMILPSTVEEEFYNFLQEIDTSTVTVSAVQEGNIVFPKVPLIRMEGPLAGELFTCC